MVASALTSAASFAARAHAAPVPPSTGRRSVAPVRSRPGPSPCSTTDGVALPRAPEPRRRDVAARANGSEGDVITTIGQYAGAAVGVVALASSPPARSPPAETPPTTRTFPGRGLLRERGHAQAILRQADHRRQRRRRQ